MFTVEKLTHLQIHKLDHKKLYVQLTLEVQHKGATENHVVCHHISAIIITTIIGRLQLLCQMYIVCQLCL